MTAGMAPQERTLLARAASPPRRLGLLGRFSVLSLISVVVLAFAVSYFVRERIHHRALASAAQSAELITRFGITPQISGADLREGLAPEAIDALDQLLHSGFSAHPVEEIRILNAAGRIVYSDDSALIDHKATDGAALADALAGRTVARVVPETDGGGKMIKVLAPLRYDGADSAPAGAFEVHLEYGPVADAIAADTHRLFLLLAVGLVLLWAVLFRIVQGASRRLRRQAAVNEHQARHDGLTGLLNRGTFYEHVQEAIASANGQPAAVMIIDLDRFKEVNDTLGHHSGD